MNAQFYFTTTCAKWRNHVLKNVVMKSVNSTSRTKTAPNYSDLDAWRSGAPGLVQKLSTWWARLRPLKQEIADLKLRFMRNKQGFDIPHHSATRYFVRFPFLSDSEFSKWEVTTDNLLGQGYSWAEFVRSKRTASGCASVGIPGENTNPKHVHDCQTDSELEHSCLPKDKHNPYSRTHPITSLIFGPRPGSKQASSESLVASSDNTQFGGYGHFRGFISTRVPQRGDLVRAGFANLRSPESTMFGILMPYSYSAYSHLIIRYRGDGRNYRINILNCEEGDVFWFDAHQFTLYTRGGPYWQIAKIPFSKFYLTNKGVVHTNQNRINLDNIRLISFTLMDDIEGPFSLELDYISFYQDRCHGEIFAYEQYDRSGIIQ